MARPNKAVYLTFDTITFSDIIYATGGGGFGGDDAPTFSPFLWTVFFKADGSTLSIDASIQLVGNPTYTFSQGDHGDLEVGSVKVGTVITVPDAFNFYSTSIEPIPLATSLQTSNNVDEPAFFGLVIVLLSNGGHVTSHGIAAGHAKLNALVQQALSDLLSLAINQESAPTNDQISAEIQSLNISKQISDAVQNSQTFCQNLWSWSGEDAEIGHAVIFYSQDDFPASGSVTQNWTQEIDSSQFGTWNLNGTVTVSDECPASAGASILSTFFNSFGDAGAKQQAEPISEKIDLSLLLGLMRDFRSKKQLLRHTDFSTWWQLVKSYSPEFAFILSTDNISREKTLNMLVALHPYLQNDNKQIDQKFLDELKRLLDALEYKASPKMRKDVEAVKNLLPHLMKKTLTEALKHVASYNAIGQRK